MITVGDPIMDYLGGSSKKRKKQPKMRLDLDSILGVKVPKMEKPLKPLLGKQTTANFRSIPSIDKFMGIPSFKAHKPTKAKHPSYELFNMGVPLKNKKGSLGSMTDMIMGGAKKKRKNNILKNLSYKQAHRRYGLEPYGDFDKDGFLNIFDCKPYDRTRDMSDDQRRAMFKSMMEKGTYDPSKAKPGGPFNKEDRKWMREKGFFNQF